MLGASREIGTIEEGKWADIVILNGDPLEDVRNTRDIWRAIKGGEEVDRETLLADAPGDLPVQEPSSGPGR